MNPHRTVANLRFHGGYYIYKYAMSDNLAYTSVCAALKTTNMGMGYRSHYVYSEVRPHITQFCSNLISIIGGP